MRREVILPTSTWLTPAGSILLELARGSAYGIELSARLEQRLGEAMPCGTLYPALGRLKEAGLIEEIDGPPGERPLGPRRRYYALSDPGRAESERLARMIRRFLPPLPTA